MLDYFAIFTKGGALLWTLQFTTALKSNPIDALNALIRTCLLEERSSDSVFNYAPRTGASQALKWTFHNVSCSQASCTQADDPQSHHQSIRLIDPVSMYMSSASLLALGVSTPPTDPSD